MANRPLSETERARISAELRRDQAQRQQSYRARALQILPNVCARCSREFSGKRLRELTVHHRDHDHNNNPPDGSNWELLCLYCHDHEHEKTLSTSRHTASSAGPAWPASNFAPFAGLDSLLKVEPPPEDAPPAPKEPASG